MERRMMMAESGEMSGRAAQQQGCRLSASKSSSLECAAAPSLVLARRNPQSSLSLTLSRAEGMESLLQKWESLVAALRRSGADDCGAEG